MNRPSLSIPARSCANSSRPCDVRLVDPEYVAQFLNEQRQHGGVLLEAHFSSTDHPKDPAATNSLHLPRAVQVHPSYLEAGPNCAQYYPFYDRPADGNLLPDNALCRALETLGITPHTPVIVYGTEPDGMMAAARLVWGLLYAGVEEVMLLDGGVGAWLASGRPAVSNITTIWDSDRPRRPNARPAASWRIRSELCVDTRGVREIAKANGRSNSRLVDVRQRGEWDGATPDHYPFFSAAGHIPSAIFQGDWDRLLDRRTLMLGPALDIVARRWRALGILDRDVEEQRTDLIFYCGTGWRSSVAFLVAHLLGFRARNYDDGFYGWSSDPANEIVRSVCSPSIISGRRSVATAR